jgi:hypothetical protein
MTPKTAGSFTSRLVLGAAILLAPAAQAQTAAPASDAEFLGALAAVSPKSVRETVAVKAAAAALAEDANPDGYGWSPAVSVASVRSAQDGAGILAARATPDSSYTPGHLCSPTDPNFKEYRYAEHIPYCNRNVTQQMKLDISAHYGILQSAWASYEFDHLIPLAIGGDSSIDNLWPQPHEPGTPDGSEGKDKLEEQLYLQMKAGTITQADAVNRIYGWFTASDMAQKAIQITSR